MRATNWPRSTCSCNVMNNTCHQHMQNVMSLVEFHWQHRVQPIMYWHLQTQRAILSGISSDILSCILSAISSDILSGILSGKSSDILSGISSDILSGRSSDILSGISSDILSDISSDILSGISSDILSGILSGRSSDNSIWHIFWHSIWHSIWQIFWQFYLAYLLTFYLAYLLTFYRAYLLTFYLAFSLALNLALFLAVEVRLRSGKAAARWISPVEVQRGPQCSESHRLRSGEARSAPTLAGWGPARPTALSRAGRWDPARLTAIKSWQMRSGEEGGGRRRKKEELRIWHKIWQPSPGRWGTMENHDVFDRYLKPVKCWFKP